MNELDFLLVGYVPEPCHFEPLITGGESCPGTSCKVPRAPMTHSRFSSSAPTPILNIHSPHQRRTMKITWSRCLILSLVLLLACRLVPEATADVEEASESLGTPREPIWLTDIPATVELIADAEVAVIGFFQDLEIPIVSIFRSMAQQFQDVSFGISNHSEVLTHYNVTSNSICLFRLVSWVSNSSLPLVFPRETGTTLCL